jgi:2-dehydro-3-deoxygluconokinase
VTGTVVTIGETMALFSPHRTGRIGQSGDLALGIGGAESNFAIGLARLGTHATWVGRVGADALGEFVLREIRAEGVHVEATVDDRASTGLMVKERRTEGSSSVMYYRSASAGSKLGPSDVPEELIAGADVLHVTGITLAVSDTARAAVMRAISVAATSGTAVSLDLNFRSRLWDEVDARDAYRTVLPLVDIVFAGVDEAIIATGDVDASPETLGQQLSEFGPSQSLIKLGEDGAVGIIDGEMYYQPAIAIRPVDTVGAGDAFASGYVSELVRGLGPEDRLRTASLAGAFACLSRGDWEGLPSRAELALLDGAHDPVRR